MMLVQPCVLWAKCCLCFLICCLGCRRFSFKEQASFNFVAAVTIKPISTIYLTDEVMDHMEGHQGPNPDPSEGDEAKVLAEHFSESMVSNLSIKESVGVGSEGRQGIPDEYGKVTR